MKRDIDTLSHGVYDVIVIGGGINGAAIAYMASLNGLKVALLEKGDFASGASSKSTKLMHGGLRYLENFEFSLVKEALRERYIHLHNSSHLVKSLGFIIPVYKTDSRPLWLMKLGLYLYDFLSGQYVIHKHRFLSPEEVIQHVAGLKSEDLLGGLLYYDAQMNDARICLENVLSAAQHGASVANYVEVKSLIKEIGKAVGVVAIDQLSGRKFEIRAKKIVCALGPWTNKFMTREKSLTPQKVRTTKGIHIIYEGQASEYAVVIPTRKDNRIFFIIPWMNNSLIGTTDTDYTGNPDDVKVEDEDIDYLFDEAKRIFPKVELFKENIISSFAGLRPLVYAEGTPAKVSRRHVIEELYTGAIYVMGGKYTTYRKIAEDCMRFLTKKKLVDTSREYPLYGSGVIEEDISAIVQEYGVDETIVQSLMGTYGVRYGNILKTIKFDKKLKEPIAPGMTTIKAQIVYSIETEMAVKEDDIIERRLGLSNMECDIDHCRHEIRKFFKK